MLYKFIIEITRNNNGDKQKRHKLHNAFEHLELSALPPIEKAVNALRPSLPFQLTQSKFDALVSFALSVGIGELDEFKDKNAQFIADEILRYCYVDGKKDSALERRRRAERDLLLSDEDESYATKPVASQTERQKVVQKGPEYEEDDSYEDDIQSSSKAQASEGSSLMWPVLKFIWDTGVEIGSELLKDAIRDGVKSYFSPNSRSNVPITTSSSRSEPTIGVQIPPPPRESQSEGPRKSISDLAREVIRGEWGNGEERKRRLREAGYDSIAVQAEVNRMMRKK